MGRWTKENIWTGIKIVIFCLSQHEFVVEVSSSSPKMLGSRNVNIKDWCAVNFLGLTWYLYFLHCSYFHLLKTQMLPDSQHSNYFSIATCVEIYKGTEFFHKLKFSDITLSLQPYSIHLWQFKLRIFDLTEFIVWNIKGLHHWVPKYI